MPVKPPLSKPHNTAPPEPQAPKPSVKVSKTKWQAFSSAGLAPKEIVCVGYRPAHLTDEGCHSRVQLTGPALKSHIDANHGNQPRTAGFRFTLVKTAKAHPLWKELIELGLEALDFRCDICDKVVPFHPIFINNHMRVHAGKSKRVKRGGPFLLTLGYTTPVPTEEEVLEEDFSE